MKVCGTRKTPFIRGFFCAGHGTNLTGTSSVTVFTAKCSEAQVGVSKGMDAYAERYGEK